MKQLVEQQGMDPAEAEPKATEAGREALIKTVADLTGVTVDHYAEIGLLGFALITDASAVSMSASKTLSTNRFPVPTSRPAGRSSMARRRSASSDSATTCRAAIWTGWSASRS